MRDRIQPVITRRQIDNAQLRAMGIKPTEAYHYGCGPGDRISATVAEPSPFRARTIAGTIEAVDDHGHYRNVIVKIDRRRTETFVLHEDGPQDWGVVEWRVIDRKWQQPQPHPERDGSEYLRICRRAAQLRRK